MITFITLLRAIAACLITNSHYAGIYPTDWIANGGLLGDIIFFAVSGYCLYNVKGKFLSWYAKRAIRIYIPVVLTTVAFLLLDVFLFAEKPWYEWFIYPTGFHFVASIILLYIPFYFMMKIEKLRQKIPLIMLFVFVIWLLLYIFVYDKSHYHIDDVREPFIRFLYMEAMLLGAWFKQNDGKYRNVKSKQWLLVLLTGLFFVLYFGSKVLFSKMTSISPLQFVNQIIIFVLLCCIMRLFSSLDQNFEKAPTFLKRIVSFVADMTLEIYLVQNLLIGKVKELKLIFPINWLLLTASIIIAALVLHLICKPVVNTLSKWIVKPEGSSK